MANWKKQALGDLPLYQATNLTWLPGIVQGFTTRRGGVSLPPYASLNLGVHVGDSLESVTANRERLWLDLGFNAGQVAMAQQIHGNEIAVVTGGDPLPVPGADALLTDVPDTLLMLLYADCVPVYLVDPVQRAVGLVHAGWRGTAAGIVGRSMAAMQEAFGSVPSACLAAIGPCIGGDSYEVGTEVADQFRNFPGGRDAGSATAIFPRNELQGTYLLNLRQIVFTQLLIAGLKAQYIAVCDQDTYKNKADFFSHRRDGPKTGRMAAFLALRPR